jgi:cytochrome o ubiquinol oxidase subunit 3
MKVQPVATASNLSAPEAEESEKFDRTTFGFWVYLMTDLVLFATLFATFGVLHAAVVDGPPLGELFSLPFVLVETILLLTSSFTCGLMILAAKQGSRGGVFAGLLITFVLGAGFLGMELHEFSSLVAEGHGWQASGAMSSFFTLVGTHGAHIAVGLLWMAIMMVRISKAGTQGLGHANVRRLTLFSLFWHFLDIVWIFIFTFVYLMGASA